jgi:hypothetical protein
MKLGLRKKHIVRRDPSSAKVKKEYERLRRMGLSPADATRTAKFRASWIGHVGDINWEDHGGGPVWFDPRYQTYHLAYVEPPYDNEDDRWHVYVIDLDAHTLADSLGLDFHSRQLPLRPPKELKSIADYTDQDWKDYVEAIYSGNPIALAHVATDIAAHSGWENALNADAEHYSYDEFVRRFGEEPSNRPEEEEKPHRHAHGRRKFR